MRRRWDRRWAGRGCAIAVMPMILPQKLPEEQGSATLNYYPEGGEGIYGPGADNCGQAYMLGAPVSHCTSPQTSLKTSNGASPEF